MEVEAMQTDHEVRMLDLKKLYKNTFNRLKIDEESTLEFYYKLGEARGVDGYQYVEEAIKRASMKSKLDKPISYIASLCKNFYSKGLYAQPSKDEKELLKYIESKIGNLSEDNQKLIQKAISSNGSTRVMAATCEILNNSLVQDYIIEKIILRVVDLFGEPKYNKNL
jgi:hypothetical protein